MNEKLTNSTIVTVFNKIIAASKIFRHIFFLCLMINDFNSKYNEKALTIKKNEEFNNNIMNKFGSG